MGAASACASGGAAEQPAPCLCAIAPHLDAGPPLPDRAPARTLQAFRSGAQELQLQAWGATAREMAAIGRDLYGIDDRVVVKLPITFAGIQAAKVLTDDAVPFTLTGQAQVHLLLHLWKAGGGGSGALGQLCWRAFARAGAQCCGSSGAC